MYQYDHRLLPRPSQSLFHDFAGAAFLFGLYWLGFFAALVVFAFTTTGFNYGVKALLRGQLSLWDLLMKRWRSIEVCFCCYRGIDEGTGDMTDDETPRISRPLSPENSMLTPLEEAGRKGSCRVVGCCCPLTKASSRVNPSSITIPLQSSPEPTPLISISLPAVVDVVITPDKGSQPYDGTANTGTAASSSSSLSSSPKTQPPPPSSSSSSPTSASRQRTSSMSRSSSDRRRSSIVYPLATSLLEQVIGLDLM